MGQLYRSACLAAGFVCAAAAAMMPRMEFVEGTAQLGSVRISRLAILAVTAAVAMIAAARGVKALASLRGLPVSILIAIAGCTIVTLGSVAGVWFGYMLPGTLVAFEYRPAMSLVLYAAAVMLLTGAMIDRPIRSAWSGLLRRLRHKRVGRWVVVAAVLVAAGSASIAWFVLDGMPHIADGCNYLLQARMLGSGTPAATTPAFVPLFEKDLYWIQTAKGFAPRGLWGFPALLAAADPAGLAWAVNPLLAGVLIVLTWCYVRDRAGQAPATLTAAILALCPWLWCNAATFMPHIATAVALMVFLICFDRMIPVTSSLLAPCTAGGHTPDDDQSTDPLQCRGLVTAKRSLRRSIAWSLATGLALGGVVMIRYQDAAFFAVPAVLYGLWLVLRRPRRWLAPLVGVIVGALPGLIGMVAMNRWITGGSATSYAGASDGGAAEGFWAGVANLLGNAAPPGAVGYAAWLHESWAQLSTQWFSGCFPAALFIVVGLCFGRPLLRRMGMLMTCSLCLLLCYGAFVFGGRSWVGPRWYVPVLPAAAFVMASGVLAAAGAARRRPAMGALARGYLSTVTITVLLCWFVAFPVQLLWWRQNPPHGVDGRVVRAVRDAGLTHAVVALPTEGLLPDGRTPNYKWLRTAAWSMSVPFENSEVMYVHAVDGWAELAAGYWPRRQLYRVSPKPERFDLIPVPASPAVEEP